MNANNGAFGFDVLFNPSLNKGTAFTAEERDQYKLRGLLPPGVSHPDVQMMRVMENIRRKHNDIERYIFCQLYRTEMSGFITMSLWNILKR